VMDAHCAEHVHEEVADVLIYLLRLADVLDLDVADAVAQKIQKNEAKHPAPTPSGQWQSARWDQAGAVATGFEGFVPFADVMSGPVPDRPGVYLVIRPGGLQPDFRSTSSAGRFKGKDPSIEPTLLHRRWVTDTEVLYVGKAGGKSVKATLRKRLAQYLRFGQGGPVGHWGGRAIFQLSDWETLLVAWRLDDQPGLFESSLLEEFKAHHGALPFANMRR